MIDDSVPMDQNRNMGPMRIEPHIPWFHVLSMKQTYYAGLEFEILLKHTNKDLKG